jgi:hypothetical protein
MNNVEFWFSPSLYCFDVVANNPKIITRKSCSTETGRTTRKRDLICETAKCPHWSEISIHFESRVWSMRRMSRFWIDHTWRKTNNVIGSVHVNNIVDVETNSIICRRVCAQCMWKILRKEFSQFSIRWWQCTTYNKRSINNVLVAALRL